MAQCHHCAILHNNCIDIVVLANNVINNCIDIVGAKHSKVDVVLNLSKTGNANTESVFIVSFMWQI